MTFRRKRYKFDPETLSFVEVKKTAGQKIWSTFRILLAINLPAFIFLFLLYSFVESPEARFQKIRINKFNVRYAALSLKVDSLTDQLQKNNYTNDQIYRYILEMDSLSTNIRYAGTGGYDPYGEVVDMEPSKVFNLKLKIDHLKRQVGIQTQSYEEILSVALDRNQKIKHFPGIPPLNMTRYIWISSYFGTRHDPFTRHRKTHLGVDFVGPRNTEIYATADGTVTLAKHSRKGYGNEIVIDHLFGHETRYAHLNEILVTEGQKVERGQLIGLMGNTGRSTGTHLHYEVRFQRRPINPIYFFADDLSPEEFEQLAKKD